MNVERDKGRQETRKRENRGRQKTSRKEKGAIVSKQREWYR